MNFTEKIRENLENPLELERLYRQDSEAFRSSFDQVFAEHSTSIVLKVWYQRLYFKQLTVANANRVTHERLLIVLLSLLAGTIAKLPAWFPQLDASWFYSRNIAFIIFPALAIYFLYRNRSTKRTIAVAIALFVLPLIFINLLPDQRNSQTLVLACLHLPFFLWTVLGFVFVDREFTSATRRMAFLKYNGDTLIYSNLFTIVGGLLVGLTSALFWAIGVQLGNFYYEYLVVYALCAVPIVATALIQSRSRRIGNLAPAIARIFSPLVLVTLIVYLFSIVALQRNPLVDRDFLVTFNVMLIGVLAIAIFTLSERTSDSRKQLGDYVTVALVAIALMVDSVALAAILFRLASYGTTPNRMVVLGANLLIFGNLAGMLVQYVRFFMQKTSIDAVKIWMTRYLNVYGVWFAIVLFIFPIVFSFK